MAAVSAIPGSHNGPVSLELQNQDDQWKSDFESKSGRYEKEPYANGYHTHQSHPEQLDGVERPIQTIEASSGKKLDHAYLLPHKQGLRPDLARSHSGSEPDSLIDLYGHPRGSAEKSHDASRHRNDTREGLEADQTSAPPELEESSWIHRDKLAMIERQEMQAAGITPPLPRAMSRSRHKKEKSGDHHMNGDAEPDETPLHSKINKKRKMKGNPRDEEQEAVPFNEFDIRTAEEIAAEAEMESNQSPLYRQPTARSSSSRIPLPRSSPMPLPLEHLERTTPLPRKRNASGTWSGGDEDALSYRRLRSRGNSVGSQVLLDDGESPSTPITGSRPTSSNSPAKTRSATGAKSSHIRKPSNSTPANGTPSNPNLRAGASPSSPLQRPKSRSGLDPRPATAINRPEGEAPWLKDMYKPDPRLPPDQQLLPTHAKRLQEEQKRQEQWEQAQRDSAERKKQQGKGSSSMNENKGLSSSPTIKSEEDPSTASFSPPLAVHTLTGLKPPLRSSSNHRASTETGTGWPLSRGKSNEMPPASPTTEKSGNAGYSPMPRIRPSGAGQGGAGGNDAKSPTGLRQPHQHGNLGGSAAGLDPFEKERLNRTNGAATSSGNQNQNQNQINRTEKGEDKNKEGQPKVEKEKGCGCCVVM